MCNPVARSAAVCWEEYQCALCVVLLDNPKCLEADLQLSGLQLVDDLKRYLHGEFE